MVSQGIMFETTLETEFTSTANSTATNTSTRNVSILDGCKILQFKGFIPWNNPDNIVSAEVGEFSDRLKGAIVLPILYLIGGPANLINMAVFFKQGLRERINVCLFALALADELYLTSCLIINGENIYTQFTASKEIGPVREFIMNHNLICLFGFAWVSQVMSAIIASERCFCVLNPLRSHVVLSTRTMVIVIVVVFLVILAPYSVVATKYRVVCVYNPVMGKYSKIRDGAEFYYRHKEFVNYLTSIVFALILPGTVMMVVVVTTSITVFKLRKAVAWRSETSSGKLSTREVALTRMLVGTSVLYIVCVMPFSLFGFGMLILPEMQPGGRYHNMFLTVLSLAEIPSYINCSFNIFIYYSMGSRYRETVRTLCCSGPVTAKSNNSSVTLVTRDEESVRGSSEEFAPIAAVVQNLK